MTIREVLEGAPDFDDGLWLYLPGSLESWTLETKGAILDADLGDPGPEDIPFARNNGLRCTLDVGTIQDILSNARQQRPDADLPTFLQAFLYYVDCDAFIDLERESGGPG